MLILASVRKKQRIPNASICSRVLASVLHNNIIILVIYNIYSLSPNVSSRFSNLLTDILGLRKCHRTTDISNENSPMISRWCKRIMEMIVTQQHMRCGCYLFCGSHLYNIKWYFSSSKYTSNIPVDYGSTFKALVIKQIA